MIKMSMKKIDMVNRILEICEDGSEREMELRDLKTRCKEELIEGSGLRSQASFLCQNKEHTYFCFNQSYLMKKTKKDLIHLFNTLIKDVQYLIDLNRSIIYILTENKKELRDRENKLIGDETREIKNALIGIMESIIECTIETLLKERKLEIPKKLKNIGIIQEELENRHIQTRIEKKDGKTFLILVDND